MNTKKVIICLLMIFLATIAFSSTVYAKTKIIIYTSVNEDAISAIANEFNQRTPDVELKYFRLGTTKIIAKVNAEIKAGGIRADLVWTAEPAYFEELKQRGLITKYMSPAAKDIPKVFHDPDGYYIGARILSIGLMYNTNLVKEAEAPKDWNDLLSSKWKNQIVHASPLYSGSATATVTGLTQSPKFGWNYYKNLAKNGCQVIKGQSGAARKIAGGEYKGGIGLDYTVRKMNAKGSPIQFVYPKGGTVTWGSPIAIFKDSKQKDAAKKFIDFVVSPQGQKFLITEYIVSVNPNVAPPKGTPTMLDTVSKALPVDWSYLVKNREQILKKFSNLMEL
jgi:iron(III) transport system substrate-binding protein